RACASKPRPGARACLRDAMRRGGASAAALDFSALLDGAGYLRRFDERGRVDVARVRWPLRANANDGALLVNGRPPIVDVSSPSLVSPLIGDRLLASVRAADPDARVWADDPGNPGVKEHDGGERVVFALPVRTCHACANLATAFVAYDFGPDGSFRGASVVGAQPAPVFRVSGEVEAGKAFAAPIGGGQVFRLIPFPEGWSIAVQDARGRDDCAVITPPYRGPNALVIHGSDFAKPGPGAPGRMRRFRCLAPGDYDAAAAALDKTLWSRGVPAAELAAARAELDRLAAGARPGELMIRDVSLGGAPGDAAPPIARLDFTFELFPVPAAK
ncbi:MAG: hypothetical protein KGM24_15335, partial [Elusimicrobia bacterium]|nr:hypothetical protein [Elusimicrobiota bacterium]